MKTLDIPVSIFPLLLSALLVACGGGSGPASSSGGTGQPTNHAPIANGGADQTVYAGTHTASLDGSQSSDPDSDAITFRWSIIDGPAAGAALTNETTAHPSLAATVPGAYTVRLIISDGRLSSTPADVKVIFAEGVLLPGDPSAPAKNALLDMAPVGVGPDKVQDGVILTRLDVFLNPAATVAQLNAALKSVQGSIVTMLHNVPAVTVAVPPPADIDSLAALANSLGRMPGVALVSLARIADAKKLPPSPAGDTINLDQLGQLIPARFTAAWNASLLATNGFNGESLCSARKVSVLIADEFEEILVGADEIQLATETDTPTLFGTPAPANELHGYEVAAILAAHFDSTNPTGANPFTDCLDLAGVQLFDLTQFQKVARIASSFPAGKFLVNFSQGYFDRLKCLDSTCTAAIVNNALDTALERAYDSVTWKALTSPRWDDFLVGVAAGNEKDKPATLIYPGLGVSVADSFMSIATISDPFLTGFLSDSSLWAPQLQPPPGGFPSLLPTTAQSNAFIQYTQAIGADQIGPAGNVLMVGAATAGFESQDVAEASFSDSDPDVFAVGSGIVLPTAPLPVIGTSFSAPQVTGLASYLWLLSGGAKAHIPGFNDLNALPSSVTRQAILANTRPGTGVNLIDAYAAILSMDASQLPAPGTAPIRLAILDLNNDGKFDDGDVAGFLGIFLDSGGKAREPTSQDYSRFDLNGDGFTGGSRTERFDLDRVGSTQYGSTRYDSVVTQQIEGSTVSFDETKLTDLNILCYYAYSPLYTGDSAARSSLLASSCSLAVKPASVTLLFGQQQQFTVTAGNAAVAWSATCGAIDATGLYKAPGASGTCTVRATRVADPRTFAEATVTIGSCNLGSANFLQYAVADQLGGTISDFVSDVSNLTDSHRTAETLESINLSYGVIEAESQDTNIANALASSAGASGQFSDTLLINATDPALQSTPFNFTMTVKVDSQLQISGDEAEAQWLVDLSPRSGTPFGTLSSVAIDTRGDQNGGTYSASGTGVFGQNLEFTVLLDASEHYPCGMHLCPSSASGTGTAHTTSSLHWQGFTITDQQGNAVPFTSCSASGTDWTSAK